MVEFSVAVETGEPGLFLVDQEMIGKGVLSCEGGLALVTLEVSLPRMTFEVGQQSGISCERLGWITKVTCEVFS